MGRKVVQAGPRRQRTGMARPHILGVIRLRHINTRALFRTKRPRRTISGESANRASSSQAPKPGPEAEANTRHTPDAPPTEDVDRLSATNYEVESAMNHRRRRTILRDACFSPRGVGCLQFGRCVPLCRSKWSSQSHGAICKRHTGKKILVIIYIPVAPET